MHFLTPLMAGAAVLVAYFVWVRPYLKSLPSFRKSMADQDAYWAGLKEWLRGRRTILIGIWGTIVGWAPELLQQLQLLDLKELFGLPDAWAGMISFAVVILMMIFRAKAADED